MKIAALCIVFFTAMPALADVRVEFDEGAPKDSFTVSNVGDCPLGPIRISIDLATAPSGLIFDVTESGAGVEVFQPFELVSGTSLLAVQPVVSDGQQEISLELNGLPTDQAVAFTIDVDDTTSARQITVSGSEIAGAEVQVNQDGALKTGTFDESARAIVSVSECAS